ncbi:hypothetical protein MML48_2g00001852 [Holotrichia oblita]|uniref:Uncharacterized protein n=1 Tax=Holotrichia oblita TaxID=644536 RepID=A0ACB9TMM4_HOLOL|nr:hypothetical protein MML48_2g00001852 [Holotrichia oblita]
MDPNRVFDLLEEIPSDDESFADDLEEVMNDELLSPDAPNDDEEVFDIENMDLITVNNHVISNNNMHWDSDDDIPLARRPDIFLPDYWTNDVSNITKPNAFVESTGPNLPDTIETPTDVFLHLFPEDLITHIVFQTNLYAFQRYENMENSNKNLENNVNYWTTEEKLALISAYEHFSDRLSHGRKRKHVWEMIANELLSLGITKSAEKCEMKWRNLIRTYKAIKDNKKSTGRGAIRFQFYNELDEIL